MIIELYVLFEIIAIIAFCMAFFTRQELLWAISLVLTGLMAMSSYNIEYYIYKFNVTIGAYYPVMVNYSYPYLMGINLIFVILSILLGLFDLFDKYGWKFIKRIKQ